MDKEEYKFADEVDETKASAQEDEEEEFTVEIEDDTPEEDRGKEPLPKDILTHWRPQKMVVSTQKR